MLRTIATRLLLLIPVHHPGQLRDIHPRRPRPRRPCGAGARAQQHRRGVRAGPRRDGSRTIRSSCATGTGRPTRYKATSAGTSCRRRNRSAPSCGRRSPSTSSLPALALGMALVVSIPLAMWSAYRAGGRFDRIVSGSMFGLISVPAFLGGIILLLIFAINWRIFPLGQWARPVRRRLGHQPSSRVPAGAHAGAHRDRRVHAPAAQRHDGDPARGLHPRGARQGHADRAHPAARGLPPVVVLAAHAGRA